MASKILASHTDGESLHWFDIAQPDPATLAELLYPLQLHPLVLKGCLDMGAGSRIPPYEQTLFIKLPMQLTWDSSTRSFLSIIYLPSSIIIIDESSVSTLESIAKEFSSAVRFHALSTSAILYQIVDRLTDEDMAFVLEARRTIESLEEAMDMDPVSIQIESLTILCSVQSNKGRASFGKGVLRATLPKCGI